jgi:mannose-1-phosphate guanylyltransferase/mannose-6-phosphate isomerase
VDPIIPVILCGGSGTRLWPRSRKAKPKPFLPLVGNATLFEATVLRCSPDAGFGPPMVVTGALHLEHVEAQLPDPAASRVIVEPEGKNTAAAIALAALQLPADSVMLVCPSDHHIGDVAAFQAAAQEAAKLAAKGWLVSFGIAATAPETGFGYLQPGAPVDPLVSRADGGSCFVEHFVEKPGAALADVLIDKGALWNTGIFVWRARVVLDELAEHTRELSAGLPKLAAGAMEAFAELVTSISIDRGLLERSRRVVVLPTECAWDDVGTWASLRRVRELDDTGNGVMGPVHCVDSSGNVIHAEHCCVVAYGISGMIVVSIEGLTFVTTLERATELGPLLNALPGSLRFNPGRH